MIPIEDILGQAPSIYHLWNVRAIILCITVYSMFKILGIIIKEVLK